MPIPSQPRQRPLEVRSETISPGVRGPDVTTQWGQTSDPGMPASFPGSEDRMPAAKGFLNIPGDRGTSVVSEHLSWKALQGNEAPGGMMSGAGMDPGSIGSTTSNPSMGDGKPTKDPAISNDHTAPF